MRIYQFTPRINFCCLSNHFKMIANQHQALLTIGRILRQGLQLHHEAFSQVTRTHAGWVEMLQKFAGDVEVVDIYFELGWQ